jgi:hypothetical protein
LISQLKLILLLIIKYGYITVFVVADIG